MNFRELYDFLRDLNNNNSKEWMDANRKRYHTIQDEYIEFLNDTNARLASRHKDYIETTGKQAINRINNNLMFHPEKPTYKDNFGASLDKHPERCEFYIHLGLDASFVATGFYSPSSERLKKIRDAIDYDGMEFKKILAKPDFKNTFGTLEQDGALKTSPKGYSQDHDHIDLLRLKHFAVTHPITKKQVITSGFQDQLLELYKQTEPFRNYLHKAISI